ncbi:hypothetical protein CTAYLR_006751 [Chrysophaeum taylorii]|uniref:non-specific serine/threonine protein kinase n=1 Tax=Chrysophaeum taylorii TaxID=2483200 RepID=A0AAD7XJJ5_9STRA|nr:hypothetical protein CTAYLR_006751 [Chrysophaeum taylorii]
MERKYEVLKAVGKGKFAVVYRAKRLEDGEIVALKKIGVDSMDVRAREKCLKEVRLLESLEHPNIIRYLDSLLEGDELVIAFEWAAAGDLKRQIRKSSGFEERVIWKYFAQISEAIVHMHDRRILHRDLKPANVFLTVDGTVKVGDLGLGRMLSEQTLEAHSKVGTPLYMSPEVLRGDGYDWKSDVWSLGCILYELAILKSPFKAEGLNLYSLFKKISAGDFARIRDCFSPQLRDLAHRMLSVEPSERPQSKQVRDVAQMMRKRSVEKKGAPEHALLTASELVVEKLGVLGYAARRRSEGLRPLVRMQFALDGGGFGLPRAAQLADAMSAAAFLVELLGGSGGGGCGSSPIDDDGPRGLLNAVAAVGFPGAHRITPHEIARGYGEAVCEVLTWLSDAQMARTTFLPPDYSRVEASDDDVEDLDGDDLILEMGVVDHDECDPLFTEPVEFSLGQKKQLAPLLSSIDPGEWELEVTRVAPRLRRPPPPRENPLDATLAAYRASLATWSRGAEGATRDAGKRAAAEAEAIARGEVALAPIYASGEYEAESAAISDAQKRALDLADSIASKTNRLASVDAQAASHPRGNCRPRG